MSSPDGVRPRTTTREVGALRRALAPWLGARLDADGLPELSGFGAPGGAGFSSDTMLFEARWLTGGTEHRGAYVLRLAPPEDAYPLFPRYELARQAAVMRLVGELTDVPVPAVPGPNTTPRSSAHRSS